MKILNIKVLNRLIQWVQCCLLEYFLKTTNWMGINRKSVPCQYVVVPPQLCSGRGANGWLGLWWLGKFAEACRTHLVGGMLWFPGSSSGSSGGAPKVDHMLLSQQISSLAWSPKKTLKVLYEGHSHSGPRVSMTLTAPRASSVSWGKVMDRLGSVLT